MLNGLDFSMSYPVQTAVGACVFFPFVLLIITQLPPFAGRHAFHFLLSFLITTSTWLGALLLIKSIRVVDSEALWVSFFLYSGVMLVYLEIWALLSRGYTLGLLLTFFKTPTPLSAGEVAGLYRGGRGLDGLIQHRFGDLLAAKMIQLQGDKVVLTARGSWVAYLYKLSILFFGLRNSG